MKTNRNKETQTILHKGYALDSHLIWIVALDTPLLYEPRKFKQNPNLKRETKIVIIITKNRKGLK